MNKKILLYIALLVSAVFVMPYTTALVSGMHTYIAYTNYSCESCHQDFKGEVTASSIHKNAAGNKNYTTYLAVGGVSFNPVTGVITDIYGANWSWNGNAWQRTDGVTKLVSLDRNNNGIIDTNEVCLFCHSGDISNLTVHVATVRGCDDDRCHGNTKYKYNDPRLFGETRDNKTAAGWYLARNNIHSSFYTESSNQSTHFNASPSFGYTPGNSYNGFISRGYYTCFGCHSDANFSVNIAPAPVFNHSNPDEPKRRYG
jgi:hypothetical protein